MCDYCMTELNDDSEGGDCELCGGHFCDEHLTPSLHECEEDLA